MSTNKKPRGDAKLKTLPAERQLAVFDYAQANSLADTVAWLRRDGIETSKSAVSYFLDWYQLRQQFAADEATTDGLLEQLKSEVPNLTEAQLDELGQRTFSLLAIRRKDLDGFVTVRSARAKGELEKAKLQLRERAEARMSEKLTLEKKRFQRETCALFIAWSEDKKAKEISKSSSSHAEKIEQLGALMFGEDWAPGGAATAPAAQS